MNSVMTKTFAKYLRLGIIPRTVRGNWQDGDYMYSLYHDSVQYTIDDYGDYEIDSDVTYLLDCLDARSRVIEKNHTLIKEIYEYIQKYEQTDIWVRVNAGMQLSATFGSEDGVIATLMLDFVDKERFDQIVDGVKKLMRQNGENTNVSLPDGYFLVVQDRQYYDMFENSPPFCEDIEIHFIDGYDGDDEHEDD
jgi:hypothetical protein